MEKNIILKGNKNMSYSEDSIKMILPAKPEYVSVARLTVSGIASRLGFDFEAIEDIKVSVAEVCNKIISIVKEDAFEYTIEFQIINNQLTIFIKTEDDKLNCIFKDTDEELSISIINALMDEVKYCPDPYTVISMMIKPK
jgi:serine/threonine-protein kinase RsbW